MSDCENCDWTDVCKEVISCPKALYGKRREQMNNSSILETFIEEIKNIVPTNDKILLNSPKIEIETRSCISDKFVRKEIILSWIEPKGEKE